MNTCLYPECEREVYSRGLCRKHYHAARYYIIKGLLTWKKLESEGKSTPPPDGRGRHNNAEWFIGKV